MYECQLLCRLIWSNLFEIDSLQELIEITSSIKSLSVKLRDCKASYKVQTQKLPYSLYRVNFTGLSDVQNTNIPEEKHESLKQMITSVGRLTDEIISNLALFTQLCETTSVPEDLVVVLTSIGKVIKSVEERIRALILQNKTPSEQSLFYLRQAIISESFDVVFMLNTMEQQLEQFDPQSIPDTPILLSMAQIARYVKRQLEIDASEGAELQPYVIKNNIDTKTIDKKFIAKISNLKGLVKACIHHTSKEIATLPDKLTNQKSPKQILFLATKVRNIRNAIRNIRGFKKVRSFISNPAKNARLTIRILECNTSEALQKELGEEELLALEKSLQVETLVLQQ